MDTAAATSGHAMSFSLGAAGLGATRLIWELPDSGGDGPVMLASAQRARYEHVIAPMQGCQVVSSILPLPAFEIPRLMTVARTAAMTVRVLGKYLPLRLERLFAPKSQADDIWCGLLEDDQLAAWDMAWAEQDHAAALAAVGIPTCCAAAALTADGDAGRWELVASADGAAYRWLALGLAPGNFLPCRAACAEAARLATPEPTARAALFALPTRLSAQHGIAELLTPICRLVFACPEDADIRPLASDRPLSGGASESSAAAKASIGFGTIRRARASGLASPPDEPVSMPDFAQGWSALDRWTPQWLSTRLRGVPVGPLLIPPAPVGERVDFDDFLAGLLTADDATRSYLFSLPFKASAPDMAGDYHVPAAFYTLLRNLPPEQAAHLCGEMFIGPAGSQTFLHQDLLHAGFWMTVIWGRKRWAFCSPDADPEWVHADRNLFDPEERADLARFDIEVRLIDQDAGDTLFVPSGWWHQVENMALTMSISEMVLELQTAPLVRARLAELGPELNPTTVSGFENALLSAGFAIDRLHRHDRP